MGEISIPMTSYDDRNREINITLPIDWVFYPDKIGVSGNINDRIPELTPGVSAFNVRLMNGSHPVSGFVAIITDLKRYSVRLADTPALGECWVDLEFSFDKVATDYRSPDVPDIPIVIKDILVHNEFIALIFAGDPDEVTKNLHTHRIFRHGDKVYHTYNATRMMQQIAADCDPMAICTILYASTSEVPDEKGKELFSAMVSYYVNPMHREIYYE